MSPAELLRRLESVRRAPSGWLARCPAHQDRRPSLSVRQADGGRLLVHCFAGCAVADIVAALGLAVGDLFAAPVRRGDVQAAAALPPVAEWLRRVRGFPTSEVARMFVEAGSSTKDHLRAAILKLSKPVRRS